MDKESSVLLGFVLYALIVLIYFIPSFIAAKRNHHQFGPIVVINILLGWTLLGWAAALAWSVSAVRRSA